MPFQHLLPKNIFSDFTLLHTDNQHFFQHHAAICIPASGGKMGLTGSSAPQIHIESNSNINLCPFVYLKAYL